jgi:hypothetical protein
MSVDGGPAELLTGALRLPRGPHRIRVERGGFLPASRDVDVPLAKTASLRVLLEPTPETRASYADRAKTRRAWSFVTMATGAAITAGGVALALVENGRLPGARADLAAIQYESAAFSARSCDFTIDLGQDQEERCAGRLNGATKRVDDLEKRRTIGWVAAGLGGALLVTGTVLLFAGDDPHRYDEKPAGRVLSGWAFTPAAGPFGFFVSKAATF